MANIIAAVADAQSRHSFPPLDSRGKSILASAVRTCLQEGHLVAEVEIVAKNLALDPDGPRTHYRELLRLRQHVRTGADELRLEEHQSIKDAPIHPSVLAAIGPLRRIS